MTRRGRVAPGTLVPRRFYEDAPEVVAPALLGKLLVHRVRGTVLAGRIVETEAYLGPHNDTADPAAHSHRGPTPRNRVLFGPAGHAYVYAIYGMYFCMNITCEPEARAGCVLLRALDPVLGIEAMARNRGLSALRVQQLASGPGKLCVALGLTRPLHNGLDLTRADSVLQIRDDGFVPDDISIGPRIGIRNARELPLRFAMTGHSCVSLPRRGLVSRNLCR